MELKTIIIYLLFSIILFYIQNIIDKKNKNNYLDNIIISNIFIIITAGILEQTKLINNNNNIFIIIIFELIIRIIYTNYIKETNYLKDNTYNIKKYSLSIVIAYIINTIFINNTNTVLPNIENIKIIIWFLIVVYLYNFSKDNINYKKEIKKPQPEYKKTEQIVIEYAKLKNQFHNIIETKYKELIPVIYSIMIYENEQRPIFLRKIDNQKYKFNQQKRKYGIMQIESNSPISDSESINISIKNLEKIYLKQKDTSKKKIDIELLIKKYYKNKNIDKILFIYNTIINF
ncbi:MAG: hypothetical protein VZS44_08870 [Bacilli bacterium]|nr:hypothetical protein [Bacilli bacterium]